MTEPSVLILIALAFLAGGVIKGLSGIGLPMVALPILSFAVSVPVAVALTMAPILVTNGWQALSSGRLVQVVRRFWPMQVVMAVTLIVATSLLKRIDNSVLLIVAGAILSLSVILLMTARGWTIPARWERPIGIGVGLLAGAIGGVSSLFGIPVIVYMSSLGLERAEFLTSVSVIYFLAAVPYVSGLIVVGGIAPTVFLLSALAVAPAMLGMMVASQFVRRIDEVRFRQLLNWLLIFLGLTMMVRGWIDV